jgi:hypothetical protein
MALDLGVLIGGRYLGRNDARNIDDDLLDDLIPAEVFLGGVGWREGRGGLGLSLIKL